MGPRRAWSMCWPAFDCAVHTLLSHHVYGSPRFFPSLPLSSHALLLNALCTPKVVQAAAAHLPQSSFRFPLPRHPTPNPQVYELLADRASGPGEQAVSLEQREEYYQAAVLQVRGWGKERGAGRQAVRLEFRGRRSGEGNLAGRGPRSCNLPGRLLKR